MHQHRQLNPVNPYSFQQVTQQTVAKPKEQTAHKIRTIRIVQPSIPEQKNENHLFRQTVQQPQQQHDALINFPTQRHQIMMADDQQHKLNRHEVLQQKFKIKEISSLPSDPGQFESKYVFARNTKIKFLSPGYPNPKIKILNHPPQDIHQIKNNGHQIRQVKESPLFQTNEMADTLLMTQTYNCQGCQQSLKKDMIQLTCFHFYHKECFQQLLQSQQNQVKLQCFCKQSIKYNLVRQYAPFILEIIMKNQLDTIFKKYNIFIKCQNCQFFYKKNTNSGKSYCLCNERKI